MSPSQLKNYQSRYKITTPMLAVKLGLTRNYIYHLRSGRERIPDWIEEAVKEIARGHYYKPEKLKPYRKQSLENQIKPYLKDLASKANKGHYEFY